jgi:hypothetical protein
LFELETNLGNRPSHVPADCASFLPLTESTSNSGIKWLHPNPRGQLYMEAHRRAHGYGFET